MIGYYTIFKELNKGYFASNLGALCIKNGKEVFISDGYENNSNIEVIKFNTVIAAFKFLAKKYPNKKFFIDGEDIMFIKNYDINSKNLKKEDIVSKKFGYIKFVFEDIE
jgi:hypothetical protein